MLDCLSEAPDPKSESMFIIHDTCFTYPGAFLLIFQYIVVLLVSYETTKEKRVALAQTQF